MNRMEELLRDDRRARLALVDGLRKMAGLRDVIRDTHGGLAYRYSGTMFVVKPSGMSYDKIGQDDVVTIMTATGGKADGFPWQWMQDATPSVDTPHYAAIFRGHDDVHAVCHTHSPYVCAFAALDRGIDCLLTEAADSFGRPVRVVPYADFDSWSDGINIQTDERAVVLAGHGCLTFGRTPSEVVDLAAALEHVAHKTFLAHQLAAALGEPVEPLDVCEVRKWHRRYMEVYGQR